MVLLKTGFLIELNDIDWLLIPTSIRLPVIVWNVLTLGNTLLTLKDTLLVVIVITSFHEDWGEILYRQHG